LFFIIFPLEEDSSMETGSRIVLAKEKSTANGQMTELGDARENGSKAGHGNVEVPPPPRHFSPAAVHLPEPPLRVMAGIKETFSVLPSATSEKKRHAA
jgi:hypothetical protein